jgi:transposase
VIQQNYSGNSLLQSAAKSATVWLMFGETKTTQIMTDASDALPDDIGALQALLDAARSRHAAVTAERDALISERDRLAALNEKLEAIIAEMRRARFGRKSERITDEQLALALDELETSLAKIEAEADKADADKREKKDRSGNDRRKRFPNLDHLPHVVQTIEPESKACPCCGGELHVIGEDVSKRLDVVPAQFRVIETHRPKFACRACEKNGDDTTAGVIQAPAPARLIEGGLPTEALVAGVVVSRHADFLPLYRQRNIMLRQGVEIERSTLADWVGTAAAELQPLHDHLLDQLKASPKLFCDETRCPVLDPGRGKTKTGFMWSLARDDRPWGGTEPPAVVYSYAPGRGAVHAVALLAGYSGILQVDGYSAYRQLADPNRDGGPVTLAYCWSHLRRKFYEIYVGGPAPIATEALARIKLLYEIEADIRGQPPEARQAARQERSKPVVDAMKAWFEATLPTVSGASKIAEAIRYGLNHWTGLLRYLDDGRIEIDSNTVERSIRGIGLGRKNSLFAGHDVGAEGWAMHASLLETCKLNSVDPLAWMTDTLTKLVNLWPASRIGELMPWAFKARDG